MPLPTLPDVPRGVTRGVTLLELLIVLVLMAVAAALVLPSFGRRDGPRETAPVALIASARRAAIRRAEPLRVRLRPDGAWSLTSQRDGATIDSGRARETLPATDVLIDALGGCVPSPQSATSAVYDPLACAALDGATPR